MTNRLFMEMYVYGLECDVATNCSTTTRPKHNVRTTVLIQVQRTRDHINELFTLSLVLRTDPYGVRTESVWIPEVRTFNHATISLQCVVSNTSTLLHLTGPPPISVAYVTCNRNCRPRYFPQRWQYLVLHLLASPLRPSFALHYDDAGDKNGVNATSSRTRSSSPSHPQLACSHFVNGPQVPQCHRRTSRRSPLLHLPLGYNDNDNDPFQTPAPLPCVIQPPPSSISPCITTATTTTPPSALSPFLLPLPPPPLRQEDDAAADKNDVDSTSPSPLSLLHGGDDTASKMVSTPRYPASSPHCFSIVSITVPQYMY
ncbi:hypothetical protein BDQ17DRAFT_1410656 [Cyathus striatus]|nr:hypothetical protein BDQ17DRAFT_1410656 [Cyathus striatus]